MSESTVQQLNLAPLGAGDLIDRAVRLYRRHLFVLIRIAAPPVIIAALGGIVASVGWRQIFNSGDPGEILLYVGLLLLGLFIAFCGHLFTLVVMGGATRNLVAHLLHNDPVSAKATYQAVRARFGGLLGASLLVLIWIGTSSTVAFFVWYTVFAVVLFGAVLLYNLFPMWLCVIIGSIGLLGATIALLWVFFLIAGRVAYVPQVMLVEGRGVFESFSRSFTIARGNVRRLMAMTLFTTFATYSAMMILLVPLGWYAYLTGINPLPNSNWPAWYQISYNVLVTLSSIMLAPVWMLGLSLLYVDERVRHEGYDIELLAAQQLSEMPEQSVASPFGPALSKNVRNVPPPMPMASGRVLDLR